MIDNSKLANRAVRLDVPMNTDSADVHVSPEQLASFWGVHVNKVYRDIRKGALRAFRIPSGRWRIRRDDMRRYGRPNV